MRGAKQSAIPIWAARNGSMSSREEKEGGSDTHVLLICAFLDLFQDDLCPYRLSRATTVFQRARTYNLYAEYCSRPSRSRISMDSFEEGKTAAERISPKSTRENTCSAEHCESQCIGRGMCSDDPVLEYISGRRDNDSRVLER